MCREPESLCGSGACTLGDQGVSRAALLGTALAKAQPQELMSRKPPGEADSLHGGN